MTEKSPLCVGIDGSKGRWMAAALTGDGFTCRLFDTVGEICACYPEADSMIIDIPLGLPESREDFANRPDPLLRRLLGRKSSSVFTTPCRQAIDAADYAAFREANREVIGKALSIQSFGIARYIKQADAFLARNPAWKNRLLEGHPEHGFMLLNGGQPVLEKKTDADGMLRRLDLLAGYIPTAHSAVNGLRKAQKDDAVDALCLALIGRLRLEHVPTTVPDHPVEDAQGILMQIVGFKRQ